MTRQVLSEGIIEKFIMGMFDAVLNKKRQSIAKAKAKDPELKRIVSDLERSEEELRRWILAKRIDPQTGKITGHWLD